MSFSKLDGTYNKSNGVTKRCPKCGLVKVLDSFSRVKKTGRIYSWCKRCESEKSEDPIRKKKKHEYYLRIRDKKIAYSKWWINNNRAKHRKYCKMYKLRLKYQLVGDDF
jgi:uncharacterized Zn finger protein (UPF0148 family)